MHVISTIFNWSPFFFLLPISQNRKKKSFIRAAAHAEGKLTIFGYYNRKIIMSLITCVCLSELEDLMELDPT